MLIIIIPLIVALAQVSPALAEHVPGEIVVRFGPRVSRKSADAVLKEAGAREKDSIPQLGISLVALPPGKSVAAAIAGLKGKPGVEAAEKNAILRLAALPRENDQLFALQWALDRISATQAWTDSVPGAVSDYPITVAVIDSGLTLEHADLATRTLVAMDISTMSGGTTYIADTCDHGTMVAGIIGARANNQKGIAGVLWNDNLVLMPVKVTTTESCGSTDWLMTKGIVWAVDHGARVINVSLATVPGPYGGGSAMGYAAVLYAHDAGALVVAAAGNDGMETDVFPAAYPHVVSVASTDPDDSLSSFSNYGRAVDIAAPGAEIIWPADPNDTTYWTRSGTSFAAPMVSGVAAALVAQDPARTPDEIVRILQRTADQPQGPGWNKYIGYGRINMYRALADSRNAPPDGRDLAYNYPNPFSPKLDRYTTFVVRAAPGDSVRVEVFDVLGNRVWSRHLSPQETAGMDLYHSSPLRWNGRDEEDRHLPNGVYLARIEVNASRTVKKIVLAR